MFHYNALLRFAPCSGGSYPTSWWFWLEVTAGLVGTVGLLVFLVDLRYAPEGYEDEDGFHVTTSPSPVDPTK